jgi:ubiquinone biosynthesis protein
MARNLADDDMIHIPAVHPALCSRRVLTMEMLRGIKGTDVAGLRQAGVDLTDFARRAAHMYLDMIFRDGFYHADPHPGNYMLLPGGVLGVLDFGMVGRIDEQLREEIEGILLAVVDRDSQQLTDIVTRLGSVPPELDLDALRMELADFVGEYSAQTLHEFDLSGALREMISVVRRYHIVLPSSCALLLKTLMMLEGTARTLQPDFSLAELIQPYYRKVMLRRYSPQRLLHKLQRTYRDWDRFLDVLPRDLFDILERTRKGTFEIRHEHHHLEVSVNRLVLGLLSASLFLGAAMLLTRSSPHLPGWITTLLGAGSLLLSGWFGFKLVRGIRKTEKHK